MTFEHKNHLDFCKHLESHAATYRNLVIFHHSDVDGAFACSAVAQGALPHYHATGVTLKNIRIAPVNYNSFTYEQILQGVDVNSDVFVVDFSFPADLGDKLNELAGFFVTLDHHASSERHIGHKPYAIFDNNSSGALMAWMYFFGDRKPPLAITLADNRDLWKKTDGREDKFHEVVMSLRSKVKQQVPPEASDAAFIYSLSKFIEEDGDKVTEELIEQWGTPYIAKRDSNIQSVCRDDHVIHTLIGGHPAVLINYPVDQSDACEYLYLQEQYKDKIVGAFSFKRGGMNFSLRKNQCLDLDLGAIAEKHYGGGGHAPAAGFVTDCARGMGILQNKEKWALVSNAIEIDSVLSESVPKKESAQKLLNVPVELASRLTCETDEKLLQWLPYLTLRDEQGNYFVYRRPVQGTETRLHNKFSLGLGGHVDTIPGKGVSLARHLAEEAMRELKEEVGLSEDLTDTIETMINEGDFQILRVNQPGTVEAVHMGMSLILDVKREWITNVANEEVARPEWVRMQEWLNSIDSYGSFEAWSDIVAKSIVNKD